MFGHSLVDCQSMSDQDSVGDTLQIVIPSDWHKRNIVKSQTEERAPSSLGTENKNI